MSRNAAAFFLSLLTFALCNTLARAGNYFQGVTQAAVPWPGGLVPYLFDASYPITAAESNAIVVGLQEWQLMANVKFIPYSTQANHVVIQYTNDGSGTGYYLSGSPAKMVLHGLARGLICHEAGHLFGLQHEHQRVIRSNYIAVNTQNILGTNGDGQLSDFVVDSNSIGFGPYDFVSVMHYGVDAFTNGLGDSIDPLPPYAKYYYKLGNLALSLGDAAAVSNLYGAPLGLLTNVVTNTADGGFGSLRAAIYYANANPGTTIRFNIPATDPNYKNGTATISLLGEMPPLVSPGTIVDGTTQPNYISSPIVVIDGLTVSPEAGPVSGLHLYGTNCIVRGLAFNDFSYAGLQLFCADATSNVVQNCYLGLSANGSNAAPNFLAGIIFQHGTHDNIIGSTAAGQGNVISGNSEYGIILNDTNSDRNVILGNYIGLNAAGSGGVSNGYSGIGIWSGPNATVIGGSTAGARNVISGNQQYGIYIAGANVSNVTVQGNYIGTDATGNKSVPNGNSITNSYGGIGIFSGSGGNLIGGTTAAARNIISGNTNAGIYLANAGVNNNVIEGNYIGLNAAGTSALTLQQNGILIFNEASQNVIGGTTSGARNVISGNQQYGIYISDLGTSNTSILGNYIGPDSTGTVAIGDGGFGIGIFSGTSGNLIGGSVPGAGNLISGNPGFSYGLAIGAANSNVVEGNLIGTDVTGTNNLGNGFADVALWSGSTGNIIGAIGAGNTIAFAGEAGVVLYDDPTTNNSIRGNSIFGNGYLGINFNNAGVVTNTPGGGGIGPNNLENYPVITNAFGAGFATIVSGTLNSVANQGVYVDVYRNLSPDYSGYGQGQFYFGTVFVTTDGSGNARFSLTNNGSNYSGAYFSATATSVLGSTSEFSADVLATNRPAAGAYFTGPYSSRSYGFVFNLTLETNFSYHIQTTTNLAAKPVPWMNLTNFTAAFSSMTITDSTATSFPARFYRVTSP